MTELLVYIVVFIVMSGLMALIEAAVLSVSPVEVEELVEQHAWGAKPLRSITRHLTRAVVVLVLCTNSINILGPILTGRKAVELYGESAILTITAVLTLGTVVFSEIIPKSLGSHHAPLISRWAAPVIQAGIYALYPLVVALAWFSNLFKTGERSLGTEAQVRSLVTLGRQAGHIGKGEGQLIHRAFILNDRLARDVMTRVDDVIAVQDTDTIRAAATHVFRHAYSRYPVYGKSIDQVRGLVMSRDILEALTDGRDDEPVSTVQRKVLVVPADMRSDQLLVRFRDAHIHLAVVQDQGKTIGLVTLEDVLEELVGEIEDEKDAV